LSPERQDLRGLTFTPPFPGDRLKGLTSGQNPLLSFLKYNAPPVSPSDVGLPWPSPTVPPVGDSSCHRSPPPLFCPVPTRNLDWRPHYLSFVIAPLIFDIPFAFPFQRAWRFKLSVACFVVVRLGASPFSFTDDNPLRCSLLHY